MTDETETPTRTVEFKKKFKHIKLYAASDIEPQEMKWLWFPYIPAGAATMIFGPGGMGKSRITTDIAARVSAGVAFPGQTIAAPPQKVLMLSAEDDYEYVLVPRLIKADANRENIILPSEPFTLDRDGILMLGDIMRQVAATVVFIDPVVSYLGGKIDINKANEVRTFTGELHHLAQSTGTAMIVVHHSKKSDEGEDFNKALGSADFNNAVRSSLYVARAPSGHPIMRHVKSNYAKLGPALRFEISDADEFSWSGTIDISGPSLGRVKDKAAQWIVERLENGPVAANVMIEEGIMAGFTKKMLTQAKNGFAESIRRVINDQAMWFWRKAGDKREPSVSNVDSGEGSSEIPAPQRTGDRVSVGSGDREGIRSPRNTEDKKEKLERYMRKFQNG